MVTLVVRLYPIMLYIVLLDVHDKEEMLSKEDEDTIYIRERMQTMVLNDGVADDVSVSPCK